MLKKFIIRLFQGGQLIDSNFLIYDITNKTHKNNIYQKLES